MPGEKGSYRSIYSAIWEDPEFKALGHVAQLVFFCLRTSKDCTFACIFTMYVSTLYDRLPTLSPIAIDEGIDTLIQEGWVRWEQPVWWIVKGLKNDPAYVRNNSKQALGIINILKSLPKLKIRDEFATYYRIPFKSTDAGIDAGMDEGIDAGMDEGIGGASKHGTGTGTGKGKGKGKKILRSAAPAMPVDNSKGSPPVDNSTGTDRGGSGSYGPIPPVPRIDPEVQQLGEIIESKRKEMGLL